ncbi:hypothetical protein [Streptomyces turgidiscabies]|uniref:hypothetical protein n=1 Tax=Streptomyces turgidiscabies TaxID=85558 RepID=UPI0038F74109
MTDLPTALITYLADRDQQRANRVQAFLDSLTIHERGLFHDAAVMGYVQGLMRDRSEGAPKDSQTMALVVDACLAFPEQYPTVNSDLEERSSSVEYFVQCQQPDGSWVQCTSSSPNGDYMLEQRDLKRQLMPDFAFRLAQRTTRVTVETERAEEPC